jgi:hypothetical protein
MIAAADRLARCYVRTKWRDMIFKTLWASSPGMELYCMTAAKAAPEATGRFEAPVSQ